MPFGINLATDPRFQPPQQGQASQGGWFSQNAPFGAGGGTGMTDVGGWNTNPAAEAWLKAHPGATIDQMIHADLGGGAGGGGAVTDQQSALKAALAQGLQGQAAVDWVQQNYPQFNQYGSGIEWQQSSGTYGLPGGYFAQDPSTGSWGMVQTKGGGGTGGLGDPLSTLRNTPGYQFAQQQGMDAIQRSAASKGTLLTGGTLKALQGYGTGLADQTYQSSIKNALDFSRLGLDAANQSAT